MSRSKQFYLLTTLVILVSAIAIRSVNIDADAPSGLSWSAGLYVDEGYKTLSPRNLILFGNTHWHEADTYGGWMNASPVTQWSIYAAFKTFDADVSTARIVPIIYFLLITLCFIYFMRRRLSDKLFYLGLILITTDLTLYTFSRVAIFEIPISFFFYTMILSLTLIDEKKGVTAIPVVGLMIGSLIIAYTLKLSALVYALPVLIAATASLFFNNKYLSKKQLITFSILSVIALVALLAYTHNVWSKRIDLSVLLYAYKIIENPLLNISPFLIIAGTLAAAHTIAYQSKVYFNNLYRLSLFSLVVAAPLLLALFSYGPVRYYVPFVPAYILLIIEWYRTTSPETVDQSNNYILGGLGLLLLGLAVIYAFVAAGLHEQIQVRYLIVISAVITLVLWGLKRYLFSNRTAIYTIVGLTLLSIVNSSYFIGSFINNPTYKANEMRERLTSIVKQGESISGGWAPFLALGTPIKVIYANDMFNKPAALKRVKPDYYVLSESPISQQTFGVLQDDEDITLGEPMELGVYNETNVFLYPLSYSGSK